MCGENPQKRGCQILADQIGRTSIPKLWKAASNSFYWKTSGRPPSGPVIAFIDVWKHRDQAPRFGIKAIPTQGFFDADGKEVYRHQGFMSEAAIVEQLTRTGVEKPAL